MIRREAYHNGGNRLDKQYHTDVITRGILCIIRSVIGARVVIECPEYLRIECIQGVHAETTEGLTMKKFINKKLSIIVDYGEMIMNPIVIDVSFVHC